VFSAVCQGVIKSLQDRRGNLGGRSWGWLFTIVGGGVGVVVVQLLRVRAEEDVLAWLPGDGLDTTVAPRAESVAFGKH
jgi:hypothetical protein